MITMIVAVNNNGTIGLDGVMPWRNKEDLQHFKATTMGKIVVMGRKTIEGLPKNLDGRFVKMVSKTQSGDDIINDFDAYLKHHSTSDEDIYVAGGGNVYEQAFPYAKRVLLSIIDNDTIGDTFFDLKRLEDFKLLEEKKYETFRLLEFERENG